MNQLFETLASNNSRNFKIDFLKQHKDNELLKEVIRLALDPFTQFYIRIIPEYTTLYETPIATLKQAVDSLSILSSRTLTGNAAIAQLTLTLSALSKDDAKVIERIIKKDLNCGVNVSTVNKVWSNLIPEYPCMLCSSYDEKLVSKIKYPAFAQCLSADWIIETNLGPIKISDLIESDLDYSVKSYNHITNNIEYNKILNKSKLFNTFNEDWYRITLNDGTATKPLTGNHLVWIENKNNYIRVDELSEDDIILSL
jgi:hypothetical protein